MDTKKKKKKISPYMVFSTIVIILLAIAFAFPLYWILTGYGDVVIHIFDEENRLFYDLERIWRDGKVVEKEEIM